MDSDQRQSYRYPVLPQRREISLFVGSRAIPAQLVDESAGGFSVITFQRLELAAGQTLVVETDGAHVEVRIAHIARAGEGLRLGLKRVDDLVPDEPQEPSGFLGRLRVLRRLVRLGDGLFTLEIVALTVVLLVSVLATALFWHYLKPLDVRAPRIKQAAGSGAARQPSGMAPSQPQKPLVGDDLPAAPGSPNGAVAPGNGLAVSSLGAGAELSRWIERMPGPEVFVLPEVVKALQLTKQQQQKIRKIADDTQAVLQRLPAESAGLSRKKRSEVVAKLLSKSREAALSVLTDEQKTRWNALEKNALSAVPAPSAVPAQR